MKKTNVISTYYSNLPAEQASATWNGIYSYKYFDSNDELFLERAINLFIENLGCYNAPNTLYCYSRDLYYLLVRTGNIKLNSISEEILQSFITQIKNSGIKKQNRTDSTMNRIKSAYRSFFSWCFKKNISIKIYQQGFV